MLKRDLKQLLPSITLTLAPRLATKWESNADQSQFTFHLDPDAKFSDGSPVEVYAIHNLSSADLVTSRVPDADTRDDDLLWRTIDAYLAFLEARAIPDYRRIPGNLSVALLRREPAQRVLHAVLHTP